MGAGGQLWQGIAGGTGSIGAEIEGEIAIKVIGHLHTSVNDKLQVVPDATAGSIANEFLTTFFKLYPTATAKELTYYVNEGVLKTVGKEYIFSELVNPVYNRNGNQVTASLAVKYLDNQTMTTQVSQFNLVLEKNGENWKIVK